MACQKHTFREREREESASLLPKRLNLDLHSHSLFIRSTISVCTNRIHARTIRIHKRCSRVSFFFVCIPHASHTEKKSNLKI